MELPEVAEFARNFAVMVRIQGPDPKGLKMQKHAFHHYHSGQTTLSASGMLLPNSLRNSSSQSNSALVVTVASIVEPFLSVKHRENPSEGVVELIPGAQVDVMVENKVNPGNNLDKGTPHWHSAQLLQLVDVPASSLALQSLIKAPAGSPELSPWEIGWSLAPLPGGSQTYADATKSQASRVIFLVELHGIGGLCDLPTVAGKTSIQSVSVMTGKTCFAFWILIGPDDRYLAQNISSNQSHIPRSTIRVALLGVPSMTSEEVPDICTSPMDTRGRLLLAVGSPFGALSPVHFFNSVSVGSISNSYPSSSSNSPLLMSDIHCFPGMEGGPVFDECSRFIGILNRPLRQKAGGVEIQLVIPWEAIATAKSDFLGNGTQKTEGKGCLSNNPEPIRSFSYINKNQQSHHTPSTLIENATASIALLTDDDGSWASGVLLNNHGLILTNAHLLEPWRFGKTSVHGGGDGTTLGSQPVTSSKPVGVMHGISDGQKEMHGLSPEVVKIPDPFLSDKGGGYKQGSVRKKYKRIRARLDHLKPSIWCDARVVYVSQGPLDIALLQLESVPNHLCPIIPELICPSPGSKVFVIGHGLFGPRSDLYPSIWSGVVSQVVNTPTYLLPTEAQKEETKTKILPAMLETTAAVHSGASGGAVINSEGHMVGLITSNSRHGGGTQIPHLNFSIPCAVLESVFKFAGDMRNQTILESLEKPHEHLASVWALKMQPVPPRPQFPFHHQLQSLPEENNKEGKGSRFAKFIAERRDEILPVSSEVPKAGKLSLLSKL